MWWIIIELLLTIKAVESQEYVRRGQNLEEFPTDIPNTTVSIDISYNSIETVNTDVLSSIVNLERLILRLNKINIFPNLSANGKTLKELNLYYNQILTVPDELLVVLPKLTKIDLEWNNLIEMPDFTSIPALTSLKLSNNKLKKIKSLTLPPSLKILELKHTPLRSLPKLRNLPLLETLDLLDTKKLFLSRDYFKDVPLFPLEDLSIGGGFKMKRMDLPDISDFGATLEKLDIQKLEIPAMPHSVFSFLTSVFSLVVNGGKYPFLPTTCPSEQENLKYEIVRSYTSRNTQLDLCDPRNLWFINHKELLDGELAMVECGNTSMVTQKIIDQYTLPAMMMSRSKLVSHEKFCAFPLHSYLSHVKRTGCTKLCLQTPGCYSFNFRTHGGSTHGDCVLVAPSGGGKRHFVIPDLEAKLWDYYELIDLFN